MKAVTGIDEIPFVVLLCIVTSGRYKHHSTGYGVGGSLGNYAVLKKGLEVISQVVNYDVRPLSFKGIVGQPQNGLHHA